MFTSIREFARYMTFVRFRDVYTGIVGFSVLYLFIALPTLLIGASVEASENTNFGVAIAGFWNHIPKSVISIGVFSVCLFLLRGRHINFRVPKYSVCLSLLMCFWFALMVLIAELSSSLVTSILIPLWYLIPASLNVLAETGAPRYFEWVEGLKGRDGAG